MSFAVFNSANKASAIRANGPHLRILGLHMSKMSADALASARPGLETRIWPMSNIDDEHDEIHWRPITNLCLINNDAEMNLKAEYSTIQGRVDSWIAHRESLDEDVRKAAEEHILRPVYQVRAESLLAQLKTITTTTEDNARPDFFEPVSPVPVSPVPEVPSPESYVSNLTRNDEILGQTWAVIAIIGDSKYAQLRSSTLDRLGTAYYAYMKQATGLTEENEAERSYNEMENSKDLNDTFIKTFVVQAKEELDDLKEEPLVAFFDVGEDPLLVNKKAEEISKYDALKHADIAVVRMYVWLSLKSSKNNNKIEHICRGSKSARDFFETMRTSLK